MSTTAETFPDDSGTITLAAYRRARDATPPPGMTWAASAPPRHHRSAWRQRLAVLAESPGEWATFEGKGHTNVTRVAAELGIDIEVRTHRVGGGWRTWVRVTDPDTCCELCGQLLPSGER